jgi:hypothetical protein
MGSLKMTKDYRPLLTFSNTADCEFFKYAQIEELATAGGFVIDKNRLDKILELIEFSFITMLNRAFSYDGNININLIKQAERAFTELKSTIGMLELQANIKSPLHSFGAIDNFLSNMQKAFELRTSDLERIPERPKRKSGRPFMILARLGAIEHALALFELMADQQPGKTKGGRATRFVQAFFKMARQRLSLYQFTSLPVEDRILKDIFGHPSDETAYEAVKHYRDRGPLLRTQSFESRHALFRKQRTWRNRARGNNHSLPPN